MKHEHVLIWTFEKDDLVLTPDGKAVVVEDEKFDIQIQTVKIKYLEESCNIPAGTIKDINRSDLAYLRNG